MASSENSQVLVKRRLLLVDDEVLLLRSLERSLRGKCAVTIAADAAEAMSHLERQSFDAIVSDDRMPGRMGHDLLREVGERWPATIRILMTGYASIEGTIDAVNRARISAFLKTPLKPAEIDCALEDAFAFQTISVKQHALVTELAQKQSELEQLVSLLRLDANGRHNRLVAEHQKLLVSSNRDPLTGLLNRRGLQSVLGTALRTLGPE
jgi:DNA-binding NtrC family response regulator